MSFYPVQAQNFKLQGAGVAVAATTMKLVSFTQIDGTVLTMADFGAKGYLTIEPGVTNEEQISFTGITQNSDGTATLTGIKSVGFVTPFTETSGFSKIHVGGTVAIITNTAGFYSQFAAKGNAESISGTWTFAATNWPLIDTASTLPSADGQLATKKYVDSVAIAGAATAGTNTLGIVKLSTAAVVATSPIVVGDNDTRVPTQAQKDALAGTSGAPSSSNKYVTNADTGTSGTTNSVVRYSGTGLITVATTPVNSTDATSKSYVDTSVSAYTVVAGTAAFSVTRATANGSTSGTTSFYISATNNLIIVADGICAYTDTGSGSTTFDLLVGSDTYGSKSLDGPITGNNGGALTIFARTNALSAGTQTITAKVTTGPNQSNATWSGTFWIYTNK